MTSRNSVLALLVATFALGAFVDVLTYNPDDDISIWTLLFYTPTAVLTWMWIRADLRRHGKPKYSSSFTWLLALLPPVAFTWHAIVSRKKPLKVIVMLLFATGIFILASLAGGMAAVELLGFLAEG